MPEPLTTYIAGLVTPLYDIGSHLSFLGSELYYASLHTSWDAGCRTHIQAAGSNAMHAADDFGWIYSGSFSYYLMLALQFIDTNWPADLTMLQLIATMSVAMPEEIKAFICLEDAYRAALWDAPYDSQYYATMVRAFKSWFSPA